ncbi:MAG: YiiX family permuted papain-like enzyme [Nitrospirota bacterium]
MRTIRLILFIGISLCWLGAAASGEALESRVRDGDIIFQTSLSSQSIAIQRATGSRYSHMGMIFFRNGSPMAFEAIQTVRFTPLKKWTARGEGGHFVVKRLTDADRILTAEALGRLRRAAETFEGRPYDLTFAWSDDRIYCSELVWKIYERALGIQIGSLQRLGEFRLDDPAVRKKMSERYGAAIPLHEQVISPAAMFDATNLTVVLQH